MLRGKADLFAQIEELILAELLDRIAGPALQLSGACQDSLERGTIESRGREVGIR